MWSDFTVPAIGFLVTMIFGFWLSQYGRPYHGMLFNIHKLIALGTVVIAGRQFYRLLQAMEMQTLTIILVIMAVCGLIALFASGAFLSIGNLNYKLMKATHTIALVLVIIATSTALHLLFSGNIF